MKTYNWFPVVGSLLRTLQDAGYSLDDVDDGDRMLKLEGTPRSRRQQAKRIICDVDKSELWVSKEGRKFWILIVLGNEPFETVADYTCDKNLDIVLDIFSNKWDGRACPTK